MPRTIPLCTISVPQKVKNFSKILPKLSHKCSELVPRTIPFCTISVPQKVKNFSKILPKLSHKCSELVPKTIPLGTISVPQKVKDFSEILPKTTFQFTCKSDFSFTYITLFRSTNSCIACKASSLRVFFSIFFSIISWK